MTTGIVKVMTCCTVCRPFCGVWLQEADLPCGFGGVASNCLALLLLTAAAWATCWPGVATFTAEHLLSQKKFYLSMA
jgi:hypothetical protein